MRSPLKLLLPLLLLVVCAPLALTFAQQGKFPAYVGHVNDFANIVDSATEQRLETLLDNFEKKTGAQIAVVTVQSLNDRPIEDYANELYRAWGIGAKSGENKNKGALLLVALQDRKTRLEVGYGLEGDLPDGLAGEIIRRMRPFLQQQKYSEGMYVGTRTLVDTLAQKWNVSLEGIEDLSYAYGDSAPTKQTGGRSWIVMLLFFLFIFIVIASISRGNRKQNTLGRKRGSVNNDWWLYPIIFNQGGGGFGSGSWGNTGDWNQGGGWSSGGSDWGGFGGGSSGGGGASDSW